MLQARHAQLLKEERTCADHMSQAQHEVEVRWRDGVWQDALQAAFRRLTEGGCSDAGVVLTEALEKVADITAARRPA